MKAPKRIKPSAAREIEAVDQKNSIADDELQVVVVRVAHRSRPTRTRYRSPSPERRRSIAVQDARAADSLGSLRSPMRRPRVFCQRWLWVSDFAVVAAGAGT